MILPCSLVSAPSTPLNAARSGSAKIEFLALLGRQGGTFRGSLRLQLESVVGVWSAFANVPTNGSWDGRGWSYGVTRHVAILFVVKGCESCKVPLGNAKRQSVLEAGVGSGLTIIGRIAKQCYRLTLYMSLFDCKLYQILDLSGRLRASLQLR
jgi:hypothetical protein